MSVAIDTFKLSRQGVYVPFIRDEERRLQQVMCAPLPGPQHAYACAPESEVILVGNRGGGKTQILLHDFLSGIGRGWANNYKGILLRRSQREFTDILTWLVPLIKSIWPRCQFNRLKNIFEWPTGESLELSYYDTEADWPLYQGKAYAWIGWEELTLWDSSKPFLSMFSCLRSSIPRSVMPRKIRGTANPSGPGHNWVKHRYRLHGIPTGICGPCITELGEDGTPSSRRAIYVSFADNALLRRTEPFYMRDVEISCEGDPARLAAWRYGDWDIVAGGGFDSIFFEHGKNIFVEPFEIPASGKLFTSFDSGSTKPWACLFWWESDGCDLRFKSGKVGHTRPGDLFLIGEIYGWNGRPNEGTKESIASIITKIQQYKINRGWRYRDAVSQKWVDLFRRGYADNAIGAEENEHCIAEEFKQPVIINGEKTPGVAWELVSKPSGFRRDSFAIMRERLIACSPRPESKLREAPGLFVVKEECPQFVRTVPVLPRSKKAIDEIDTNAEDHIYDACVYGLMADRSPHVNFNRRQVW
jgi:hypothetical protein